MNDQQIEQEIQAKGLTAPRVTPADVEAAIIGETYTVLPNGRSTVCQLTLDNGFTVEGISAAVSIENFNAELGNKIARQNAVNQVWPLLGFRLRDQLDRNERSKPGLPALSEADARADIAGTPRPDNPGLNTNAA
ncbi:Gp49 family protein [Stenotrophomonas sp.]|uniref:Gp49 family protein n=1 Tax=Stenotrophomonas sp. TaxID=69392 RepID=UPI0028B125EE|nr:Gp49 family protein [Stenotrophomonas sp.]